MLRRIFYLCIFGLADTLLVPILVIVSSVALAYVLLKLYDEPVRRYFSNKMLKKSVMDTREVSLVSIILFIVCVIVS